MAKDYTLTGISDSTELGLQGDRWKFDPTAAAGNGRIQARDNGDTIFVNVQGADAVEAQDFVTFAQFNASAGPEPVTDFTIPAVPQVGYDEITLVLPQRAVDQDFFGSPTPLRLSLPAINIPADAGRRLGLGLPNGNPTRDLQVRTLDNFVGPDGELYTPGIWTFAVTGDFASYTTLNWEAADGTVSFPTPPAQITSIVPDSIVTGALPVNVIITGTGGTLPALADIQVFFSLSQNDPPVPALVTVNAANQVGPDWAIDLTINSIDPTPPGAQPYSVRIINTGAVPATVFAELYQAFGVDFSGTVTPFQPSSNVWIFDWNVQGSGVAPPGGDLFRFSVGPAGTNAVFTGADSLADALAAAGAAAAIEGQAIVVILPGSYSTPSGTWTIPRNVQVAGFAARRSLVRLFGSVTFANQGSATPPDNTQSLSHVTIEVDVTPGGNAPGAIGIFMEPAVGGEVGSASGDRTLWDVEMTQVGISDLGLPVAVLLSGYRISVRECSFTVVDPGGVPTNIGVSVREGPLRMSDTTVEMTNIDQYALRFGFDPGVTVNAVSVTDCTLVGHVQFTAPASGTQGREFTFSKFQAGQLREAINIANNNLDELPRFVKNEIVCSFSPQLVALDDIVAIDNVIDSAPALAEILTLGSNRVQARTTQEQTVIARRALTARGGFSRRGISTDVHASGFFTFFGDAQVVRYVLTAETSDATPTVLLNDGQQVDPVPIGNNRLYRVLVTARAAGVPTNSYFAEATFSVARDAGPAVQLVAPILPVSLFNGLPAGVGLSGTLGFGVNQEPQFIVTGALATTIRWVARVEVLELQEP
jgi:hypothetical protein